MRNHKNIKLSGIDPEDFGDTLLKLEKSFGVQFGNTAFSNAKTFGDICDIIESQLDDITHRNDCTTQQAFYKVRKAISLAQNITKKVLRQDQDWTLFFHAPTVDKKLRSLQYY